MSCIFELSLNGLKLKYQGGIKSNFNAHNLNFAHDSSDSHVMRHIAP